MQSWTRQSTACLFCQFRQPSFRHSQSQLRKSPLRHREISSSPVAYTNDRRGRGSKARLQDIEDRDDRYKPRGKGAHRPFLKEFPRPGRTANDARSLTIRKTNENPRRHDPDLDASTLHSYIQRGLIVLQARLTTPPSVENDAPPLPSLMQKLDPEEKLWPKFIARMTDLQKPTEVNDDARRALYKRLKLAGMRGKEEVEQELYYEFLDFALRPVTRVQSSESSMPIDLRYPTEWYSAARSQQRTIHLHVGPTNSGKTYNALKRLQETKNGFYAGPLRLLAHEVYSRFRANGIACDLITGDDVRLDESADTKVYASTVEMVQVGKELEVAVIDEIQMMGNEERGWAWTRAFLGANAKEVHLCGEARVVPLIRELSASMGDTLHIHSYERLNPLRTTTKSLRGNLKGLRKGDCIVAFSIMQIHALKKQIEVETGRRCAIVYGSLPPETRAEQADLFNDPDNDYDYLVASDAIGMGLNLSVKRIIFNSVKKYDGTKLVQLTVPQIKQIAGRAGRYRSAHQDKTKSSTPTTPPDASPEENVGLVTCLDEADLPIIESALRTEAPPLRRAGILPPAEFLEDYSQRLPIAVPFEYLMRKVATTATLHPRFFQCDIRDKLALARITDDVSGLTIEQRVNITAAPSPGRNPILAKCLKALAKIIASQRSVDVSDIPEIPLETLATKPTADRAYLESLESLHRCLILYLWLSYRFMTSLRDRDMATHAKHLTEQKINWTLRSFSANPRLRARLRQIRETQTDLAEGHFNTEAAAQENTEPATSEAHSDQPAEVYEESARVASEGQEPDEHVPQLDDFGAGEAGLDIGREAEPSESTIALRSEPKSPEVDAFLAGESKLDIAQPRQSLSQDEVVPPSVLEEDAFKFDEHVNNDITLSQKIVSDAESQGETALSSDPVDAAVQPKALGDESEEQERLRGAAGG